MSTGSSFDSVPLKSNTTASIRGGAYRRTMLAFVSPVMAALPTLDWKEQLLRLGLAAVLGGIIGIERQFREQEAGLRTHMLVAVGAALFTIVSAFGFHDVLETGNGAFVRLDPSRIAAQIVSGIGFLGAGAIIRQGLSIRGSPQRQRSGSSRRSAWPVARAPTGQP
jgi:hypothetical protein